MPMSNKLIKQMNEYYGCEYIVKKKPKKDKPVAGKTYALTGARGTRCIANGNSWAESEVQEEHVTTKHVVTIDWGQEKQERKTYAFASQQELDAFMKGIEEADGWQRYEVV